jgi:multiple antibiotic resistance protein
MEFFIQALVTIFVAVEPMALVPTFAALTGKMDAVERRRTAVNATLIAGGVLIVFAIAGRVVLDALGIGIPAMRIAGGLLLLLLAIDMVFARESGLRSTTATEQAETRTRHDVTVFPLAVPLIAGPAATTAVVLLMGEAHGSLPRQGLVLAVLGGVLAVSLAVMLIASTIMRRLGVTGVNVVTRVLGILLAALAVQFMLDGLTESGLFAARAR